MHGKSLTALLVVSLVAIGCGRKQSTSDPPPDPADPGSALMPTPPTDLSTYGIPGVIDLPPGMQITQFAPGQVAIDKNNREDDPFELRISPHEIITGTVQSHRKNLLGDDPYEFIIDEPDGYAAWQRNKNPHPMANHKVEVFREVMLGGSKFVASVYIEDFRANRQLVDRVWKAAKSLRPK